MSDRDHTSTPRNRKGKLRVVPPPPAGVTSRAVTPDHAPRSGEGGRLEAARLHSEGVQVSEIARRLGVARETVSRWVNHRAVEAVAAEREARAQEFRDSVAAAREKLKAGAARAAEVLVAQLDSTDPAVASAAARTLLDRVGVPRAEVVVAEAGLPDLSGLTEAELDAWETLNRKIGGRG